jgi:sugar lactone lactonase YvrE
LAGNAEESGDRDGSAAIARFAGPAGVTVDGAGNLFVADAAKHTIRKTSVAGIVSTLAGSPGESEWVDAAGNLARLNNPRGLVVDAAGNVFIADTGNQALRKVTPDGQVITLAFLPVAGPMTRSGARLRPRPAGTETPLPQYSDLGLPI